MRLTARQTFVAVLALFLGGCGHTIPGSLTGDGKPYDFAKQHACADPQPQGDQIQVRYLGSGGIYLRWRDEAILIGPSFSNPGLIRARFLRVKPDKTRIESALNGFEYQRVGAILAGHSHYDHLADIPEIARRLPSVPIWVNENGTRSLAGEGLGDRVHQLVVSDELTDLTPSIRVRAVESGHAPQLCRCGTFRASTGRGRSGRTGRRRCLVTVWRRCSARDVRIRDRAADGDAVRYRIYYNDASPDSPLGQTTGDFDLAILCMAQWKWLRDYPRDLLAVLRPRHVLVSHWDNFFTEARQRTRFVPNLSDAGVAGFLTIVNEKVSGNAGPVSEVCGVKTPRWTMAAPASSMLFEPRPLGAEGMP